MQIRKNVNNDVSMNPPIGYCVRAQAVKDLHLDTGALMSLNEYNLKDFQISREV